MVKEYQHWKTDYAANRTKLTDMQRQTEDLIQPLQDELAQIEEKI